MKPLAFGPPGKLSKKGLRQVSPVGQQKPCTESSPVHGCSPAPQQMNKPTCGSCAAASARVGRQALGVRRGHAVLIRRQARS